MNFLARASNSTSIQQLTELAKQTLSTVERKLDEVLQDKGTFEAGACFPLSFE